MIRTRQQTTTSSSSSSSAPRATSSGTSNSAAQSNMSPSAGGGSTLDGVEAGLENPSPDRVTIQTPAGPVDVDVPPNTPPSGTFNANPFNIPGVTGLRVEQMSVNFDENFTVTGGNAQLSYVNGPVTASGPMALSGNSLSGTLDARIDLPGIGTGEGTASFAEGGFSSAGTILAADLQLKSGLSAESGELSWKQSADGVVSGDGSVSGSIPTIGTYALELAYNETLSGAATITLTERTLAGAAKLDSGTFTGTYGDENLVVQGTAAGSIGDWATGTGAGTIDVGAKELTGTIAAVVSGKELGPAKLESGTLDMKIEANVLTDASGDLTISAGNFRGTGTAEYVAEAGGIDAVIAATYASEEAQTGNVHIKTASGNLNIEQNIPTSISEASATVGVLFNGEERAVGEISSLTYEIATKNISGGIVGGHTTQPVDVGSNLTFEIPSFDALVENNTVTEISGQAKVDVGFGGEKIVRIDAAGTVIRPDGPIIESATGSVTLIKNPFQITEGFALTSAEGTVTVANNEVTAGTLSAGFHSRHFDGLVDGGFDPKENTVDGTAEVSMHTAIEGPAGFTVDTADGSVLVEQNVVKTFDGGASGKLGDTFEYSAEKVDIRVPEKLASGTVSAGIQEGKSADLQNVGSVDKLDASGTVADNVLERVDGTIGGKFSPGGADLMSFDATGAYRTADKTVESAEGSAKLLAEQQLGPITITKLEAGVTVTENEPDLKDMSAGFKTDTVKGDITEATFDLQDKMLSGEASAELLAPLELGPVTVSEATGKVTVLDNTLSAIEGSVKGKIEKDGKVINFAAENVLVDTEAKTIEGTVKASTEGYIDLVPNVLGVKVTDAEGTFANNALTSVSGGLEAKVSAGGKERLRVGATDAEFNLDTMNVVSATGEVELLSPFEVFGDKFKFNEFAGTATVENNSLTGGTVTASAEFKAFDTKAQATVDGSFTKSDDGFDIAGEASVSKFDVIKPTAEGRQLSAELEGSMDTAANTFSATGKGDFRINESFGGTLEATMDQEFDPGFKGSLDGKAELVQETELFNLQKTIVFAPIPPIFGASLDASLAMNVGALTVSPEIEVTDYWRPLTSATTLPDFDTTTEVDWGVTLSGGLEPYLYGGLRMPGVKAAVGGKGGAIINADAGIKATVGLRNEGGAFKGDVGLGVDVTGSLDLKAGLFAELGIDGWESLEWEKDDLISYTIEDIFSLNWAKTFEFGDGGSKETEGAAGKKTTLDAGAGGQKKNAASVDAPGKKDTSATGSSNAAGGPTISGDSALSALNKDEKSDGASGDEGETSGLQKCMEALDAMKALYDSAGGAVKQLANFPMGTFALIWDIFQGKIDFGQILADATRVKDALVDLMKYIAPMLEGWFDGFWSYIKDGPPNLLKALFGDSGAFRDVINDGITIENCPPEMLNKLLEGALWDDMFTTEADEAAMIKVVRAAGARGLADQILTPERTRKIFDELDHRSNAFKQLVYDYAPASTLRNEIKKNENDWRLSGSEETRALALMDAAASRGLLASSITQATAERLYDGMDGSNRRRMKDLMSGIGIRVG